MTPPAAYLHAYSFQALAYLRIITAQVGLRGKNDHHHLPVKSTLANPDQIWIIKFDARYKWQSSDIRVLYASMSAINIADTSRNHWRSIQLEHFKPLTFDGVGIDSICILLSPLPG